MSEFSGSTITHLLDIILRQSDLAQRQFADNPIPQREKPMLNVNIKFGKRALPIITQLRKAGYVIPIDSPQERTILEMFFAEALLISLYRMKLLNKQDVDAARVRIEAKVRKLRLKKR